MDNRRIGALLIGAGVLVAVLGLVLWNNENERVNDEQVQQDLTAAFLGQQSPGEIEPNRSGPYFAFGVAALLFLSGVIFMATARPVDRPPSGDDDHPTDDTT